MSFESDKINAVINLTGGKEKSEIIAGVCFTGVFLFGMAIMAICIYFLLVNPNPNKPYTDAIYGALIGFLIIGLIIMLIGGFLALNIIFS